MQEWGREFVAEEIWEPGQESRCIGYEFGEESTSRDSEALDLGGEVVQPVKAHVPRRGYFHMLRDLPIAVPVIPASRHHHPPMVLCHDLNGIAPGAFKT